MPVRLMKFERNPNVDRNEFARAVLQLCRAQRRQPKIQDARFFWVDGGNTVGLLVQGQPGCFDFNPEPDPELMKAGFAVTDMASLRMNETWNDAGIGERNWERAGRPSGVTS
jgi:hypothetical protein